MAGTAPGAWKRASPTAAAGDDQGSGRVLAEGSRAPPFDEAIEATLTADGDPTILVIEVRGMPLDKIAFYGAGWQIHAENLAAARRGGTSSSLPIRTWRPTSASYSPLKNTPRSS
jgi:hypothetical protein